MNSTEIKIYLNNLSNEDLLTLAKESRLTIIPDDCLLRKTCVECFGEEDGEDVMYLTVQLPLLALEVMAKRFSNLIS